MTKRELYIQKLEAQLREWNSQLDDLLEKAEKVRAGTAAEYTRHLDVLKEKMDAAENNVLELKGKGEGAWEEIATGMERVWEDLKATFENAGKRIK